MDLSQYTNIDNNYFKENYDNYKEKSTLTNNDNRPSIGNFNLTKKNILSDEKMSLKKKIDSEKKNKQSISKDDIFNKSTIDLSKNIAKTINNISSDYNTSFSKIKNNYNIIQYDNNENIKYTFIDKMNIHLISIVDYINSGTNIAYIGMFMILISFLIYIINIII